MPGRRLDAGGSVDPTFRPNLIVRMGAARSGKRG